MKTQARSAFQTLFNRYKEAVDRKIGLNEEAVKLRFVVPMLRALGWDVEGLDQVQPEHPAVSGRVDFALRLGRDSTPVVLYELKALDEDLDGHRTVLGRRVTYPQQAIDYAWQLRVDFVVLTNYREFRLYYSHVRKPEQGLLFAYHCEEFADAPAFDRLWNLSRSSVQAGALEQFRVRRTRADINVEILKDLFDARNNLVREITSTTQLSLETVRESVQRILDRLVFMRVAEDRGIIQAEGLARTLQHWEGTVIDASIRPFIEELRARFEEFNRNYDSRIFEKHSCDSIALSNATLAEIVKGLYKYNFDLIDADILGAIYEDYIGHIIRQRGAKVELEPELERRQAGGSYFTPLYVVDYILRRTLTLKSDEIWERVLKFTEAGNLEDARRELRSLGGLQILDPACGSGSFLIKAFDSLGEIYRRFNEIVRTKAASEGLHRYGALVDDFRRTILLNNLHGVDIDLQACEIASLNLGLKVLRRGERLPLIMGQTVKQGNTLVAAGPEVLRELIGENWTEHLPFDWKVEYPEVMEKGGGFDVVVGNPPWGSEYLFPRRYLEHTYALATGQYDSYELFIELATKILGPGGVWGFVIPASIFQPEHERLRQFLLQRFTIDTLIRCGEGLFDSVHAASAILVFRNAIPASDHLVRCMTLRKEDRNLLKKRAPQFGIASFEPSRMHLVPQNRFLTNPHSDFDIYLREEEKAMIGSWEKECLDWAEVTDTGRGVELSGRGEVMQCPSCFLWDSLPAKKKGGGYEQKKCSHCNHQYSIDDAAQRATVVHEGPQQPGDKPFLVGEDVNRYYAVRRRFIDTAKEGINYKPFSLYRGEKILIRKTSLGIYATIDETENIFPQVVYAWKLKEDRPDEQRNLRLEYILGVLNSRLILYYLIKKTGLVEWQSFPYITQELVHRLPIKKIDFTNIRQKELHDAIVGRVTSILRHAPPVDPKLDYEVEALVMDLYGVNPDQRTHILTELKQVQQLRIIREMFPEESVTAT